MHRSYDDRRDSTCLEVWPWIIPNAFPNRPEGMEHREPFYQRFHAIKELRNRVFHHEPIWHRGSALFDDHKRIIETISWMNPTVAEEIENMSPFPVVYQRSVGPFQDPIRRAQAARRAEGQEAVAETEDEAA